MHLQVYDKVPAMKPIRFEDGRLVGQDGEPVALDEGEQLITLSPDELETACKGLFIGARDRIIAGDSIINEAYQASSYSHKHRAAEKQATPAYQQGAAMTELAEDLKKLT